MRVCMYVCTLRTFNVSPFLHIESYLFFLFYDIKLKRSLFSFILRLLYCIEIFLDRYWSLCIEHLYLNNPSSFQSLTNSIEFFCKAADSAWKLETFRKMRTLYGERKGWACQRSRYCTNENGTHIRIGNQIWCCRQVRAHTLSYCARKRLERKGERGGEGEVEVMRCVGIRDYWQSSFPSPVVIVVIVAVILKNHSL